ncbi:aminopeptidase N [Microbacteriaceae bacterium SG_E_30_P1]|uniref:Aminopeptidase N n=1 Tax=Antiquaquibacter oligotrophicus TaxID=2880260 RepID=A0ABT6KPR0_9MICO|nr:M1 family metallopeptidase [Antiquaquibacter oligotrophicus]MDH6181986.1 aminopeptidase N [Antiquaquibacter oligotrophicus]UDF12345.1 M1 family metallopeptidase [Antiquaquibacter oligotrophicus]
MQNIDCLAVTGSDTAFVPILIVAAVLLVAGVVIALVARKRGLAALALIPLLFLGVAFTPGAAPALADPCTQLPPGTMPEPSDPCVVDPDAVAEGVSSEPLGDTYYPDYGNVGYDVQSYHVEFVFDPEQPLLEAVATIVATATTDDPLAEFSFDFETLGSDGEPTLLATDVTVDCAPAEFEHAGRDLTVSPSKAIAPGDDFAVVVTYSGTPGYVDDVYGDSGWHWLTGGAALVMGEPASSSAWFPSNAHPLDKALFSVTGTVPFDPEAADTEQWRVSSNGEPVELDGEAPEGWWTFGWAAPEPMATYLTTLFIDKFEYTVSEAANGVTIYNSFSPGVSQTVKDRAARTEEIMLFFENYFGDYPFTTNGGQFTNDSLGYALETQTRSSYSRNASLNTIAHEIAHQWVGDSVTLSTWADMCLNECLAEYAASWLWSEHTSGTVLDTKYSTTVAQRKNQPAWWATPLVDMGAGNEFNDVYTRGSLAIHALRKEMGDDAFFDLLYRWATEKAGQNVTWAQFEDMVDEVAGRDLGAFMSAWFTSTGVPADEYLYPGDIPPAP